jgi:hypothetical protein
MHSFTWGLNFERRTHTFTRRTEGSTGKPQTNIKDTAYAQFAPSHAIEAGAGLHPPDSPAVCPRDPRELILTHAAPLFRRGPFSRREWGFKCGGEGGGGGTEVYGVGPSASTR